MGSGIEGTGDLSVGGGSLTATHIIQDALVIGGSVGNPAVVTIAASDANGNPLATAVPSAPMSNAAINLAVTDPPSVGASSVAGGSATGATTPSIVSDSSFASNLPSDSSSHPSRGAAAPLFAAFGGIGSTASIRLAGSWGGGSSPSRFDSAPSFSLAQNEFAISGNRAELDVVFSAELEASGVFRPQWLGADLPPRPTTLLHSALSIVCLT